MKINAKKAPLSFIALTSILLSYTVTAADNKEIKKYIGEDRSPVTQNANGVFTQGSSVSVNGMNTRLRSSSQSLSTGSASAPLLYDDDLDIEVTVTPSTDHDISLSDKATINNVSAFSYTLNDDFNGDGCTDTATVSGKTISIFHPCSNNTQYYNFSGDVAVNGVYDTDGEPGKEIGVVNAPYFEIIDDEGSRKRSYNLGNNWAINGHYDADGNDGDEIGIVMPNHLLFIIDNEQKTNSNYLSWRSWSINGNYDTDGNDGVEIGVVTEGYFSLFDLRDYAWRHYGIPGNYFVNGAQDIDGKSGKEILINNYPYRRNATIYDASYQITWENY